MMKDKQDQTYGSRETVLKIISNKHFDSAATIPKTLFRTSLTCGNSEKISPLNKNRK